MMPPLQMGPRSKARRVGKRFESTESLSNPTAEFAHAAAFGPPTLDRPPGDLQIAVVIETDVAKIARARESGRGRTVRALLGFDGWKEIRGEAGGGRHDSSFGCIHISHPQIHSYSLPYQQQNSADFVQYGATSANSKLVSREFCRQTVPGWTALLLTKTRSVRFLYAPAPFVRILRSWMSQVNAAFGGAVFLKGHFSGCSFRPLQKAIKTAGI